MACPQPSQYGAAQALTSQGEAQPTTLFPFARLLPLCKSAIPEDLTLSIFSHISHSEEAPLLDSLLNLVSSLQYYTLVQQLSHRFSHKSCNSEVLAL